MTPTELLKHEHKIILIILSAAEKIIKTIQTTIETKINEIKKLLDFFTNFVDRCHHTKEERLLFTKMNERGIPKYSGLIPVMLKEHEYGREKLNVVSLALPLYEKGDLSAKRDIVYNLEEYIKTLKNHIDKEDNILYPLADSVFTNEDRKFLQDAFDKIEKEEIGEGVHEKYHKLAHELLGD